MSFVPGSRNQLYLMNTFKINVERVIGMMKWCHATCLWWLAKGGNRFWASAVSTPMASLRIVLPKTRQDSACVVLFCSLAALSFSPRPYIRSRSALARPLPCKLRVPPASRSNLEFLSSFLPFSFLCTCKNPGPPFVGTVNSSSLGWWTGWKNYRVKYWVGFAKSAIYTVTRVSRWIKMSYNGVTFNM